VLVDKRRKIESESEARRCLAAVRASGVSLKEWSRGRGIDGRSLHAWKMNLERSSARPRSSTRASAKQLVELVQAPTRSSSRYVLRVGSASVEFGDDFDPDTLRRVVEVVRSSC
jgi:hypothetical protein